MLLYEFPWKEREGLRIFAWSARSKNYENWFVQVCAGVCIYAHLYICGVMNIQMGLLPSL